MAAPIFSRLLCPAAAEPFDRSADPRYLWRIATDDEEKLHCLFAELEFNILVNCWKMGGFDSIPRRACAR